LKQRTSKSLLQRQTSSSHARIKISSEIIHFHLAANLTLTVHQCLANASQCLYLQVHYASFIEYMIIQICIQFNKILLEIHDALINSLLCSLESTFCLKVANFRIAKFSMQVFNVILSVKYLIMITYVHHMISSLIARLF